MDIFENQPVTSHCEPSEKVHTDAAFDNNNSILDRRDITSLQPEIFTDCNIESLDLSNNRLQNFPKGVKLPLLKKLNLSNNEIQDIYFLSEYSSLEELNVDGNPQLQLSDKFLLVTLLPKLKLIDGVDCTPMRDEIDKLDLQIDDLIDKECHKELSTALYSATFDCNNFKRCLELKVKSMYVDVDKRKAVNYKIERKVKAKVEEEYSKLRARFETNKCETAITNTNERRDENVGEKKSPIVESNFSAPPRKREVQELTDTLKCDTKRSRLDMDSGKFDYDAMLFIRCHSSRNDPYDCQTQVWKAAFAPKTKANTDSDFVASCGGNIVCLIDCVTATVKKRYCDANINERFFCLAWTVVPRNGELENLTLAVGGSESYIVLLDGVDLLCFCKFKAHEKDVNTLLFHPTKPTWLLSGSYDQRIKVWDIDDPSREKNKAPKLLLEVHAHNFLLQLVYSEKHNTLLAAGEDGLTFWPNFSLDKKYV
ncbi:leucine-rich repeat and WD repeat-containing protein 1-like isoform X2 [Leptotrombidium deliense]|uniref:Leucine-rich repeat and WD repeat-containing protein 1 n=1 Tax=Leptotrombidium deliense TaxID=299467 RepID=A0A443SWC7_9ACAR|nr:leucine-rich repeat and WD repeat-containing protein 1-like isoform X2 [Leptotrombidium deliense]